MLSRCCDPLLRPLKIPLMDVPWRKVNQSPLPNLFASEGPMQIRTEAPKVEHMLLHSFFHVCSFKLCTHFVRALDPDPSPRSAQNPESVTTTNCPPEAASLSCTHGRGFSASAMQACWISIFGALSNQKNLLPERPRVHYVESYRVMFWSSLVGGSSLEEEAVCVQ